jgi:hypothetical protein|tara:strand:+ start:8040 stop:9254 length:1215 start_codon:yes stop_codon:yes gene_type:complete
MKNSQSYFLWFSIASAIGAAIYVNFLFFFSEDEHVLSTEIIQETPELSSVQNLVDISIANVLIYPNQYDKNSIYIDTEISNINGEGNIQIALTNDDNLIASSELFLKKNIPRYFQSFLISENIDFNKDFEISISAINAEKDISNNRYTFKSYLKIEKPKVAILTGKLNFNTPFILNNINAEFSHYYPDPLNGDLDITNFWFNKYDIIILDKFPTKPVSDKWLNLFLKKIYSEKSSLIIISHIERDFMSLKKFLPIFGLKLNDENEFRALQAFTRFSKDSFKSSLILTSEFYNLSSNNLERFSDTIEWILLDSDVKYSFFIGSKDNKIHKPFLFYGYSNILDNEIQTLRAHIIKDQEIIKELKLLYNPISGYYFSSALLHQPGEYKINIKNDNKLVDTINVNLYD